MARPFFAQLFSSSSKGGKKSNKKQESSRKAYTAGPPTVSDQLNVLNREKDPWMVEWQKRREDVVDEYWSRKKRLRKKKKIADKRVKRQLGRMEEEINKHYRLHELDEDDPRRERALSKAAHKFKMREKEIRRDHREDWKERLHELQKERDKEKRQITKSMKKESRMARGERPGGDWY